MIYISVPLFNKDLFFKSYLGKRECGRDGADMGKLEENNLSPSDSFPKSSEPVQAKVRSNWDQSSSSLLDSLKFVKKHNTEKTVSSRNYMMMCIYMKNDKV